MEQYSDDERVEDLKKWWRENGLSIMFGIGLGLVAIWGWRYWTAYRNDQAVQASVAYEAFVDAVEKPDLAQAAQRSQTLLADFPKSTYATFAKLRLGKVAVEQGDLPLATQHLQWVVDNAPLSELRDIAQLRLARVLFASGKNAEAEKLLGRIETASLSVEREELRGDLALAAHDPAKARTAYTQAMAAAPANQLIQIKLDNLAAPSTESVVAAPAQAPSAEPEPAPVPEANPENAAPTAPVEEGKSVPAAATEIPVPTAPVEEAKDALEAAPNNAQGSPQ